MATPKTKLDLSSIGWEYCEIRGKRFSDLLAVRLRLRPNLTRGVKIASADKSALTQLGFVLIGSELERTTPSAHGTVALTKREISMVFKEFDAETMVVPGQRNTFEPRGEFISFSTHQTVSVPQAMLATDHQTGKAAGLLQEADFHKLVKERTVSLSNLRRLHEILDPEGKFGETAVFHVAQKVRDAFNAQIDTTDEIALFAIDGKTFNPPLRIVYDDAVAKPSVFSDYQAYCKNLKPESSKAAGEKPSTVHDQVARGIYQKAVDASTAFVQEESENKKEERIELPPPIQRSAVAQQIPGKSFVVPKPAAKALPSFAAKAASMHKNVDLDKADDSIKKMFGGEMERKTPAIQESRFSVQQQTTEQRSFNDEQPLSITDFLKEQSLLKLSFKAVLKKIPELFAQYANGNPQIDESFFNRATRMFIREESLRIMAGIASRGGTSAAKQEAFTSSSADTKEAEEDDLFEVGTFEVDQSVATASRASSAVSAPVKSIVAQNVAPHVDINDEFAQFEKPAISTASDKSGQPPPAVSRPAGGFMSKLKGSVESNLSASEKTPEVPPNQQQGKTQSLENKPQSKSNLEFSSVLRKPGPARPLPNFGR